MTISKFFGAFFSLYFVSIVVKRLPSGPGPTGPITPTPKMYDSHGLKSVMLTVKASVFILGTGR